jgi:pimeloyl-ACP methyl ester carboxylesterase
MAGAEVRITRRSRVIPTGGGPLEHAVAGDGPATMMMIHGTGGGFDQGLLFAHGLLEAGLRIVAPSRFGYLGSGFPHNASPARQADVLVDLLDHLGLERIAVAGGSAGALTAAEFALRHPDRCAQFILIVPAANLTGRDPVEFNARQRIAVERVLSSDAWFWTFATLAQETLLRSLLATDPALLDRVSPEERRRADLIREGRMPISRKTAGLRNHGYWAGAPALTAFQDITSPTLILSCEDELFGTAESLARGASSTLSQGHIWPSHDDALTREISAFIATTRP